MVTGFEEFFGKGNFIWIRRSGARLIVCSYQFDKKSFTLSACSFKLKLIAAFTLSLVFPWAFSPQYWVFPLKFPMLRPVVKNQALISSLQGLSGLYSLDWTGAVITHYLSKDNILTKHLMKDKSLEGHHVSMKRTETCPLLSSRGSHCLLAYCRIYCRQSS